MDRKRGSPPSSGQLEPISLGLWGPVRKCPPGLSHHGEGGTRVHPSVPFLLEAAQGAYAWTSGLQALADGESPRQRLAVLCGAGGDVAVSSSQSVGLSLGARVEIPSLESLLAQT